MKWTIKHAKAQPRSTVAFLALSSMPSSIKFYQSLGFKKDRSTLMSEEEASATGLAVGQVFMTYPISTKRMRK